MKKVTFLVAICLLAAGCSNVNLQKPTASVTAMNLQDADANGFTMNFDVDIKNPNSIALPLSAADYKLGLAGRERPIPADRFPATAQRRWRCP